MGETATLGVTDIRSVVICLELVVVDCFPRLPCFGTPPFWPATPFVDQLETMNHKNVAMLHNSLQLQHVDRFI